MLVNTCILSYEETVVLFGRRHSAGTKRRSQVTGHSSQVTGHRSQVTGHRSQVTGHGSQVTGHRKCNKKVRHSAGLFMFVYLFHFRTSQSGICVASTMLPVVLRVKELKLHIVLELEEFFLSFGFLETSKRCFNLRSTRRNLDWGSERRMLC